MSVKLVMKKLLKEKKLIQMNKYDNNNNNTHV